MRRNCCWKKNIEGPKTSVCTWINILCTGELPWVMNCSERLRSIALQFIMCFRKCASRATALARNKNITKAQQRRMDIITREVGCICCRITNGVFVQAQANHLLAGYRRGHDDVTPECPWHHTGECLVGVSKQRMRRCFGPSRKLHKKTFHKVYGSDDDLLVKTNLLVEHFEQKIVGKPIKLCEVGT